MRRCAFRLHRECTFGVSAVDEESAVVLMASKSSEVSCIVIRGVLDLAGGGTGWSSTSFTPLLLAMPSSSPSSSSRAFPSKLPRFRILFYIVNLTHQIDILFVGFSLFHKYMKL